MVFDSLPERKITDNKVQCYSDSLFNKFNTLIYNYVNLPCGRFGLPLTNPNSPQAIVDRMVTVQDRIPGWINSYSDSLYNTLRKTITIAVDAVAKENGYQYVLDSSNGAAFVLKGDEDDLTALVMQKLGIK